MAPPSCARKGFTLVELMIAVAIIGLLASIAIPSFSRYIRRSKTTEAALNIRKMFDAAVAYHSSEHADSAGILIKRTWPLSPIVGFTPATTVCCGSPGQKCAPNPAIWQVPIWQALLFSVDDPHYYSYWFSGINFGAGDTPGDQFMVEAVGDLDCDTDLARFRRFAVVNANRDLFGGGALYTIDELE
ncbi:MAG: prepilin-type N-terminal cleavage/methylation domain-containing protein [Myxococcales bacterium]|nr:prepilin-type N-terminal cleavage/methylation domain-containing protein [Myxococcales bacterium]